MRESRTEAHYLHLTADIVAAHVGNSTIATDAVPNLIRTVYHALIAAADSTEMPIEPKQQMVAEKRFIVPHRIVH